MHRTTSTTDSFPNPMPPGSSSPPPTSTTGFYLLAALELLAEIGFENVAHRVAHLSRTLTARLAEKGYEVLGDHSGAVRSGITTFRGKGMNASETVNRLMEKGIVVVERNGAIRVSPHIHNNEDDLDRLLQQLP